MLYAGRLTGLHRRDGYDANGQVLGIRADLADRPLDREPLMNLHAFPLVLAAIGLSACPGSPDFIECRDDTSCGLAADGQCLVNPSTGHQFCAYPDSGCPDGLRWSDVDVEDSISGTCVMDDGDGGVDAVDAPVDAAINDGTIPCGLKVAFHDGADNAREVWIANADGTGLINVSNNAADDASPTWAPDGMKLAFQSKRNGGRWDILIVNADGSGLTNITNTSTLDETSPVWSPDGQLIAFLGNGFNVMYPNGTGIAPITTRSPSGPFVWSPDSTRIAFPSVNPNVPDVFVATIGSGAQPVNVSNSGSAETGVTWWPGTKLAYSTTDLITVNGDGTGSTNLTTGTQHFEYSPHWTADAQTIFFTSNEQTDYEIHRIAATGGAVTRVLDNTLGTGAGVGDWVVDVAADGSRILFERRASFTAAQIGSVNVDGSGAVFFNGTGGTNARGATFARCP